MYTKEYNVFKTNSLKILSLFSQNYSEEIYLREISRSSSIPLKTTQNLLAKLEKESILKSEIEGKNKYFSLNLKNPLTKMFLLQTEIYKTIVFLQKYPLLKSFVKELNTNFPIIVFGSFAKLEANKNSDIDMLIVSEDKKNKKNTEKLSFELVPFKVHEIRISEESFDSSVNSGEALIKEIQEHHIVLNNHLFYVNMMWKHAKR